MIRRVTAEESLERREAQLERLREPGQTFDLDGHRRFVLVSRTDDAMTAIELDAENIARLLRDEPCRRSTLDIGDLHGLHVHEVDKLRAADDLAARSMKLYKDKIRTALEPRDAKKFIAIEPDTEGYFLGDTATEALLTARAALPGKHFFVAPVGRQTTHDAGGQDA